MDKEINDFIVFCIEVFKEKHKLTGEEVYDLFEKYKVFKYLTDGYDMLHTQGDKWIINDIEIFLSNRGFNINN